MSGEGKISDCLIVGFWIEEHSSRLDAVWVGTGAGSDLALLLKGMDNFSTLDLFF